MLLDLKKYLYSWNRTRTERQKLQHGYLVIVAVTIIAAGIVSLFNAGDGHKITFVALAALVVFVSNVLVWSILNSAVIVKLPKNNARRDK